MSLFQFILIISSFIMVIFAIDAYQRKKLNFLHFFVFFWWAFVIFIFSRNNELLNTFWKYFGIARWADLLVYIAIIMLWLFYFDLLNKLTKSDYKFSKFISNDAINRLTNSQDWEITMKRAGKLTKEKDKYVFLVRCYNEESMVGGVIDSIYNAWFRKIVVVNDWSSDSSLDVLRQKQKQYDKNILIYISHAMNTWWGSANKTGFRFLAKYWEQFWANWLVTYDADGQMNINDMERFMDIINNDKYSEIDVLLGTRFIIWWSAENISFPRKCILAWSRIVTFIFNKMWVTDPHNWYRVMKINNLKNIKIYSNGMLYASELLDEIKRLDLKYKEVPVRIVYTDYSVAKWQKNSNAIKILLEMIYKKFFFK